MEREQRHCVNRVSISDNPRMWLEHKPVEQPTTAFISENSSLQSSIQTMSFFYIVTVLSLYILSWWLDLHLCLFCSWFSCELLQNKYQPQGIQIQKLCMESGCLWCLLKVLAVVLKSCFPLLPDYKVSLMLSSYPCLISY